MPFGTRFATPPGAGGHFLYGGSFLRQASSLFAPLTQPSSLFAPALLLPLATMLALTRKLPDPLALLVDAAPLLVFGGAALLGIITRRGRLVLGIVVLALADCALINFGGRAVIDAVGLLLPLNLAVIVWLREENPLAGRGAFLFGLAMLQGVFVALLHRTETSISASLEPPVLST